MKNFKLLLATTAMLSMGAMVANATDDTFTLTTTVDLLRPALVIEEISPLHFGRLYAENGAIVVAEANGGHGTGTTASIFDPVYGGSIKISGGVFDVIDQLTGTNKTQYVANLSNALSGGIVAFPDEDIDLTDGNIVCGTIDKDTLTQIAEVNAEGGYLTVGIGGTLTLADDIEEQMATAKRGLQCSGGIVLTAISND